MGRRLHQTYQVQADPHEPKEPQNSLPQPPTSSSIDKFGIQNQPFDSSMGLTILVLLTALFFMGFFSIYIRRSAHESSVELSRRRSSRLGSGFSSVSGNNNYVSTWVCSARNKGLDVGDIQRLPVLSYGLGLAKQHRIVVDCAVCLAEFEEGESVKMLPSCRHLFHSECIDTWLVARASCPICRTTRIFEEEKEEVTEASGGGMRRCCSCSEIDVMVRSEEEGRGGGLQRTRSF